jgi:hypothetical protein
MKFAFGGGRFQGTTMPPIERLKRIAELVVDKVPFTPIKIALEMEVSEKTIRRDMDFMRDRLGYDLVYCPKKRNWTGTAPVKRIL